LRSARDLQSLDAALPEYPNLSIVITSSQRAEQSLDELRAPIHKLQPLPPLLPGLMESTDRLSRPSTASLHRQTMRLSVSERESQSVVDQRPRPLHERESSNQKRTMTITLKGMTWDHPRGYAPLAACSALWRDRAGVEITWDRRSLQDFESFPVDELARRYDLIVIDHPHAGQITREACLRPFDLKAVREVAEGSVGESFASYC
jgi:hypothetical protein